MLADRMRFVVDRPEQSVDRPPTKANQTRRVPKQEELSELSLRVRDLERRVASSVVQGIRPGDDSETPYLLVMCERPGALRPRWRSVPLGQRPRPGAATR